MNGNLTQITCKDCKREFTLTEGEVNFFKLKNFPLPKRCSTCRENRKKLKQTITGIKKVSRELSINDSESVIKLKKAIG